MHRAPRALLAVLLFAACGDDHGDSGHVHDHDDDYDHPALDLSGEPETGAAIFGTECSYCHGDDGVSGTVGPPLDARVPDLTDGAIIQTMVEGNGNMSVIELDDQGYADVLAWLRLEFG